MDINQPKSRTFNIYLRYFQLGLQVLIATKLSQINATTCEYTFQRVSQIVTFLIIGLNSLAMMVTQYTYNFPRMLFFVCFILNLIFAAIIVIMGVVGLAEYNACANNRVLYKFAMIEGIIAIIFAFMIISLPFHWIQRYSNMPGNLVWIFLLFGFGWSSQYKVPMLIQGLIFAIISAMTFCVNLVACKGVTTYTKKAIVMQFIFGSVLMIIAQVLAVAVYLQSDRNDQFIDNVATKVLQTLTCVNILDLLFWLWGYLTLQYENGDKIRDELMRGKHDHDKPQDIQPYNYQENIHNPAFGTIKL